MGIEEQGKGGGRSKGEGTVGGRKCTTKWH